LFEEHFYYFLEFLKQDLSYARRTKKNAPFLMFLNTIYHNFRILIEMFNQIFTLSYQGLKVRRKLSPSKTKSAESSLKRIGFTRMNDQISVVVEEKASNVDVSTEWRRFQNELIDVAESQVHPDDAGYPASSDDRLKFRI
jgi:hypothetical protein